MAHQVARGFFRSLEWILVAMLCGCTVWLTYLVIGFVPPTR